MLRNIQKRLKDKKGFTLVELIVVIAILGIIAAIAVPKFGAIQENSKVKADAATMTMIEKAVETYFISEGSEPANIDTLVDEKYLDKIPTAQQKDKTGFSFTVDADGNATVSMTE